MKIIIPGGTGFIGQLLTNHFSKSSNNEIVILSRGGKANSDKAKLVPWDARTLGSWAKELENAELVINLTGKSVKCLYTEKNLKEIRDSRVNATQVIGQAIKQSNNPPKIWFQMCTSAIYAHSFDYANDETNGKIGEDPQAPHTWKQISKLAMDWEKAFQDCETPQTRKILGRLSVVMGSALNKTFAFDIFVKLAKWGLGGTISSGHQMVSWIHSLDFVNAIQFILDKSSINGAVNLSSPNPLPQKEFMTILRKTAGAKFGLPTPKWLLELSSYIVRIDSELSLKSRYVLPKVLMDHGFSFQFPHWEIASKDLYSTWKKMQK